MNLSTPTITRVQELTEALGAIKDSIKEQIGLVQAAQNQSAKIVAEAVRRLNTPGISPFEETVIRHLIKEAVKRPSDIVLFTDYIWLVYFLPAPNGINFQRVVKGECPANILQEIELQTNKPFGYVMYTGTELLVYNIEDTIDLCREVKALSKERNTKTVYAFIGVDQQDE